MTHRLAVLAILALLPACATVGDADDAEPLGDGNDVASCEPDIISALENVDLGAPADQHLDDSGAAPIQAQGVDLDPGLDGTLDDSGAAPAGPFGNGLDTHTQGDEPSLVVHADVELGGNVDPDGICACASDQCVVEWIERELGCGACVTSTCGTEILGGCVPCVDSAVTANEAAPEACVIGATPPLGRGDTLIKAPVDIYRGTQLPRF